MYTDFYGLTGFPFQLTPDYRFFFDSGPHRRALAYLNYGLSKGEGFIVITGEVGAGKTTLIDHLLFQLEGRAITTARIVTSQIEANDLLHLVADAFGVHVDAPGKGPLLSRIGTFLTENHAAGRRTLLIIDEVQGLRGSALEELRMLSNFGMGNRSILQICLVGQPEFRNTLASASLEQLRQRIIASHHLYPLDAEETRGYILHRLALVGWDDKPQLSAEVFERIHQETGGIPRKINLLCDRLLLFGYLEEKMALTGRDAEDVIIDMREEMIPPPSAQAAAVATARERRAAAQPSSPESSHGSDLDDLFERVSSLEHRLGDKFE